MGRPPTNLPRVTFRFPEGLREKLEDAARDNNRSVNAEVVARLERTFTANEFSPEQERAIRGLMREEAQDLMKNVFEEYADRVQREAGVEPSDQAE